MDTVQFRDYIFPHNPAQISVSESAALAGHLCPGDGELLQELGEKARVITCSGSFFSQSREATAAQLAQFRLSCQGVGRGMLYLPGMEPMVAALRECTVRAEGDGRILPYTMVFVESRGVGA